MFRVVRVLGLACLLLSSAWVKGDPNFPGGEATHQYLINANAFSHPSSNLSYKDRFKFELGDGLFKRNWVAAPASTRASDGLGPLHNARSCQGCHLKDGRGHPPGPGERAVSMFLRLSVPGQDSHPVYGSQLQNQAVAGLNAEGEMQITYETVNVKLAGGETVSLRKPNYSVADPGYGPLGDSVLVSPRVAPQMIGLGLLEAIKAEDIVAQADPEDKNQDGISGKVRKVKDLVTQTHALGRFGWKAGSPTVRQQTESAFHGDIGMSTPLFPGPEGDCTPKQTECIQAPHGIDEDMPFEASQAVVDLVVFYSQNLAVPKRRETNTTGEKYFTEIGCANCHTPSYTTGDHAQAHLAHQVIYPYTNLLLHDMGEGLADNRSEGNANGREWRTAPLWGIGLTQAVNGHTFYLHDGRARNLQEAILWHGGEAQTSRDAYANLSKGQRQALLDFIGAL